MNFIKKINTYLLEYYPLIWNTRLVWMLGLSILTHILFFGIGYFSVSNFTDIQSEATLDGFYFGSPVVFFNVLLSIIILLIWIIYYLQNNAFKNLYVIKKGMLLRQLGIILLIFFININQYYSFKGGLRLKVRSLYSWEEVDADIKEFNKVALFLLGSSNDYEIDRKQYPSPFPLEYKWDRTYKTKKNIDTNQSFFTYGDLDYQFYKVNKNLIEIDKAIAKGVMLDSINSGKIKERIIDTTALVYKGVNRLVDSDDFKYRIVKDVSFYKEDIDACLLNYSSTLYNYGQDDLAYKNRIKFYERLFEEGNEKEIKKNLQSFLDLAKKYKIDHNLNVNEWYGLFNDNNYSYETKLIEETALDRTYEVFKQEKTRKNYEIKHYILKSKPSEDELEKYDFFLHSKDKKSKKRKYYYSKSTTVDNRVITESEQRYFEKGYGHTINIKGSKTYSKYKEVMLSQIPYYDLGNLEYFFKNSYEAYQPNKSKKGIIFLYFTITLFCGLLLFIFKITDIKSLLLSIVAAAVILIITGLLINYTSDYLNVKLGSNVTEPLIAFLMSVSVVVASIFAFKLRWQKLVTAILFSLSIFTIPFILIFAFLVYQKLMDYHCNDEFGFCKNQWEFYQWLKIFGFWIMLIIWSVCISFYVKAIRKWKGLPE